MQTRPRIQLILSPLDKMLELAGKILLVLVCGLGLYAYIQLPTIIPIHFNASGQADNYGNKITILLLPLLAIILYFGLTQLNKYPHVFNYMTTITEENAAKQYTIATRMLRFLKLSILLIFFSIILITYLTVTGVMDGPGAWFLPIILAVLLIPTFIMIGSSLKKSK